MDLPAVRDAARRGRLVWICDPNNPTGLAERRGAIEALLAGLDADAAAEGRAAPAVVVDEAYSEFTGSSVIPLRTRYPNLVAVRTASKAYALAGLRVGFAVAAPPRSAGSPSSGHRARRHDLRDGRGGGAPRRVRDAHQLDRVARERPRLAAGLAAAGWRP